MVRRQGFPVELQAKAVVASSGGFQANLDWLSKAWGPAAANFLVRGTPYATGTVLQNLLEQGVASVGDPSQCHAVAIDGRAPKYDGGIVTRLDCVPFSVVVNRDCNRFYDEGEDIWPKRYAIWGRLVAQQPGQIAYSIIDSRSERLFMPSVFPALVADSISGLANKLGLNPSALENTIADFNRACVPGAFNSRDLDGLHTESIDPQKSNWARPISHPPFSAYPLRPGITFTYLGVKVDERARVILRTDEPVANLFASGEIMAGSILGKGYLAGFGMAIGTVFGRIAGLEAARHAAG
jgi:tricarballylate dehydrogenase